MALASICAHLCHLAAIRLHVSLLAGSRAVFAIDSHSLARVKNSSGVCIERLRGRGRVPLTPVSLGKFRENLKEMVHVLPYRGGAPMVLDLVAGQVQDA